MIDEMRQRRRFARLLMSEVEPTREDCAQMLACLRNDDRQRASAGRPRGIPTRLPLAPRYWRALPVSSEHFDKAEARIRLEGCKYGLGPPEFRKRLALHFLGRLKAKRGPWDERLSLRELREIYNRHRLAQLMYRQLARLAFDRAPDLDSEYVDEARMSLASLRSKISHLKARARKSR